MKKRTAFIAGILSLMPLGQPLLIKTSLVLSSSGLMLLVPEKANADSAMFYLNKGNEKFRLREYYLAISLYNKAIKLDPTFALAYTNRGAAKRQINDLEGALIDQNKSIQLDSTNPDAYNNREMLNTF